MCIDIVEAQRAVGKYCDMYPAFQDTRECKLLQVWTCYRYELATNSQTCLELVKTISSNNTSLYVGIRQKSWLIRTLEMPCVLALHFVSCSATNYKNRQWVNDVALPPTQLVFLYIYIIIKRNRLNNLNIHTTKTQPVKCLKGDVSSIFFLPAFSSPHPLVENLFTG